MNHELSSRVRRSRVRSSRFRQNAVLQLSTFSDREIALLKEKDPQEVIAELSTEIKRFQSTLENSDICCNRDGFESILSLLLKVSSGLKAGDDSVLFSRASIVLGEVFSERCTAFHNAMKICIMDKRDHFEPVCNFFEMLLIKLPYSTWHVLPVDELLQTIKNDNVQLDGVVVHKAERLVELRNKLQEKQQRRLVPSRCVIPISSISEREWDNSEYRTIPIFPVWEEINNPDPPHQLRPNIVKGKYDDWLHYYDIQFRLLREDFISPLRKSIRDYSLSQDLRKVKVYYKVQILRPRFTKSGLCYEIRFDYTPFRRCQWEHSKRLMFGSLLCLSPDKFHSKVLFATVSSSDPIELYKGIVQVMFQKNDDILHHMLLKTEFVMVESPTYFEASQHILRSLQTAEVETMPFRKYLIANDCTMVNPPKYLNTGSAPSTYNMQFIIKHYDNEEKHSLSGEFKNVAITYPCQWPPFQMTELDEFQLEAMKMALTQEISVIQGPPGTGKTYIGLKIVQALLKNRSAWNTANFKSPILIMCQTNHALDQFLEGILEMNGSGNDVQLVRVGGRSKSEKIQEHTLYNVRRKLKNAPKSEFDDMKHLDESAVRYGEKCSERSLSFENHTQYVPFKKMKHIIENHFYFSLIEHAQTPEEEEIALELWLCLYVREENIPMQHEERNHDISDDSTLYCEDSSSESDEGNVDSPNNTFLESPMEEYGEITANACIEDAQTVDNTLNFESFAEMKFKTDSVKKKISRRVFKIVEHSNSHLLKKQIMTRSAMTTMEVEKIDDILALKLDDRYRLYKYWHSKYVTELEISCRKFSDKCDKANRMKQRINRYVLEAADIIGMTTTGAAKHQQILHLVKPKIVVVEEAAEILESHIVSALNAGTHHLILLGDHKQLRPNPDHELALKYKLDISLFERLVDNGFPCVTLKTQRRMRPEISNLVRGHIYKELNDHTRVESYPKVKGTSSNLFLIQHNMPEEASDLSYFNKHEAKYLAALCKFLLQQGYSPNQITILVTYTGQLLMMKEFMPKPAFTGVRVATVDNFQGEENDIILLSLVRSKKIGFLKKENRICVALSRARQGFFCIGNFEMLRKCCKTWQSIVTDMVGKGKVGESLTIHCNNHPQIQKQAKTPEDFDKYFPKGGCHLPCNRHLECGHRCTLTCHSSDPEHKEYICQEEIIEVCQEGHTITRLCFEEAKCTIVVERQLQNQCGHKQLMRCYENPDKFKCIEMCIKTLPSCGHSKEMPCYWDPKDAICEKKCEQVCTNGHACLLFCCQGCEPCMKKREIRLSVCGHTQVKYCYQKSEDVECMEDCEKKCSSGHPCKNKCSQYCGPCSFKVEKTFPCGHKTMVECCEYSVTKCKEPCPKILKCGHKCSAVCGDPCTEKCEVNGIYRTCLQGHILILRCFETLDLYPCKKPCKKKMKCGHTCQNHCGEICSTECKFEVIRKYPCGHQHRLPCSSSTEEHPCDYICKASLACGHACRGKCSECRSTRIHKQCKKTLKQRHFCGEMVEVKCDGLRHSHVTPRSRLELHCAHTVELFKCATEIYKCSEPCQWSCPHYECTRLCHEICNRPPCDEKCPKLLGCGHPCVGLCGEPCVSVCPKCSPEIFRSLLCSELHSQSSGKNSGGCAYTQLRCGHIFTLQDMEERMRRKISEVGPLQCPACFSLLSLSGRYGNPAKEALSHVGRVKERVGMLTIVDKEERNQLKHILAHFSTEHSDKLIRKNSELFSKPVECIANFQKRLHSPNEVEKSEAFILFLLSKVLTLTNDLKSTYRSAHQQTVSALVSASARLAPPIKNHLSYQMIQDLLSETYRLYYHAKLNSCPKNGGTQIIKNEESFLRDFEDPNRRMSREEFVAHSKRLDILMRYSESTDEFIEDIDFFEPKFFNGCWRKCGLDHYYSIPACKPGIISMECPECTGMNDGCTHPQI